ncbi:hypothetical protein, partial [Kitasatospora albolonga]|uniref:hypothetical protein n=1 Tax=Kitasatospora albolonga TaxID=68173 RepID=UPI0031F1B428
MAETRPQRRIRLLKRWALLLGLVVTAVSAVTGIATGGLTGIVLGVMSLLCGALGVAMTAVGLGGLWLAHRQRYLLRHGITVEAERLPDQPWTYAYTDTDGVSRSLWAKSASATLEVAYAPGDPSEVVVRRSGAQHRPGGRLRAGPVRLRPRRPGRGGGPAGRVPPGRVRRRVAGPLR